MADLLIKMLQCREIKESHAANCAGTDSFGANGASSNAHSDSKLSRTDDVDRENGNEIDPEPSPNVMPRDLAAAPQDAVAALFLDLGLHEEVQDHVKDEEDVD